MYSSTSGVLPSTAVTGGSTLFVGGIVRHVFAMLGPGGELRVRALWGEEGSPHLTHVCFACCSRPTPRLSILQIYEVLQ